MNPKEGALDTIAAHKRALEAKNNPVKISKKKVKEDSE